MVRGYARRARQVPWRGRRRPVRAPDGTASRGPAGYSAQVSARPHVLLVAAVAGVALAAIATPRAQGPRPFLEQLLTGTLGFTTSQLTALRRGDAVTAPLPGSVDRELVMAGAIRIQAPVDRTVAIVRDIERFESGARFLARKRLSEPPRLEDFGRFHLTADDVAALRRCRPGRCDIKLDQGVFPAVSALDWTGADAPERASALLRRRALDHVEAYRQRGRHAAFVYHDRQRPVVATHEFADMVTRSTALGTLAGDLMDVLLHYPGGRPPDADEIFYWSVSDLGLKPVFRVHHVVIRQLAPAANLRYVMATRLLYADHYFNSGLDVRALIDDPAPGGAHILVTLSLARLDGITGLLGRVARIKVRAASRDALATAMRATRDRAEGR